MSTRNQLINGARRPRPRDKDRQLRISPQPQYSGTCKSVGTTTPRKPNSAVRKVAKVRMNSQDVVVNCYIPGEGHSFQEGSKVIIRCGRTADLIGYKYKILRSGDCAVSNRKQRRSLYGAKKPAAEA